jgi:hypothetical protein
LRERSRAILGLGESTIYGYLRESEPRAVSRRRPDRLVEIARGFEVRVGTDTDKPRWLAVSVD